MVLQGGIRFCAGHWDTVVSHSGGAEGRVIPLFPSSTTIRFLLHMKTVGLGDLLSSNTIYIHIHTFPSQENVTMLGTKCLGLSAAVFSGAGLAGPLGKLPSPWLG